MNPKTFANIKAHAEVEFPRECCGLITIRKGKEKYLPCRNISPGTEQFSMHPEDYAKAEDQGSITMIVHSHPNGLPSPSQADRVGCEASGLPWLIIGFPSLETYEFAPTGYQAPLIGRVFSHGVLDCYSLIRDWYQQKLNIELPDFERENEWWLKGQDLYRENFKKAGFHVIDESQIRKHDVILMQLGSNKVNHGAVLIDRDIILHHPMNRLSGREVFGGFWRKNAVLYLHHKDVP